MGAKETSNSGYIPKKGAADYTSLSPRTLDKYVAQGDLPAYKVGRKLLFKRDELDAFVARHKVRSLDEVVDQVLSDLEVGK